MQLSALKEFTNLEMKLAINRIAICIDHLECVTAIAIHMGVAIRDSPVTEQKTNLMCGLWSKSDEIPEHVRVLVTNKNYTLLKQHSDISA